MMFDVAGRQQSQRQSRRLPQLQERVVWGLGADCAPSEADVRCWRALLDPTLDMDAASLGLIPARLGATLDPPASEGASMLPWPATRRRLLTACLRRSPVQLAATHSARAARVQSPFRRALRAVRMAKASRPTRRETPTTALTSTAMETKLSRRNSVMDDGDDVALSIADVAVAASSVYSQRARISATSLVPYTARMARSKALRRSSPNAGLSAMPYCCRSTTWPTTEKRLRPVSAASVPMKAVRMGWSYSMASPSPAAKRPNASSSVCVVVTVMPTPFLSTYAAAVVAAGITSVLPDRSEKPVIATELAADCSATVATAVTTMVRNDDEMEHSVATGRESMPEGIRTCTLASSSMISTPLSLIPEKQPLRITGRGPGTARSRINSAMDMDRTAARISAIVLASTPPTAEMVAMAWSTGMPVTVRVISASPVSNQPVVKSTSASRWVVLVMAAWPASTRPRLTARRISSLLAKGTILNVVKLEPNVCASGKRNLLKSSQE
mmetsp:Transcript_19285/g.73894  ORF Transcript_19285/g.73894 Transcript_19285/m.73894 type:complete len:500 (+) Transcript_19285:2861-4360(+)